MNSMVHLSDFFVNTSLYCQCGREFRLGSSGEPCLPAQGKDRQKYICIKEAGRHWGIFAYDPYHQHTYTYGNAHWYKTPCAALYQAALMSAHERLPVRVDLIPHHSPSTQIDWATLEQKTIEQLYNDGVRLYHARQGRERMPGCAPISSLLIHPIQLDGWNSQDQDLGTQVARVVEASLPLTLPVRAEAITL